MLDQEDATDDTPNRVQVPQYHRATALPPQQLSLCLSEGEDTCTGGCEAETQGGVRRATPETDICVPLAGGVLGGHQTWKHCHRPRRLAQRGLGKLMQRSLQSRRAEREMLGGSTEGLPASCPCPQGAVHPQQDQARGSGSKLLDQPSCAPASASLPVSAGSKLGLLGGLRGGGGAGPGLGFSRPFCHRRKATRRIGHPRSSGSACSKVAGGPYYGAPLSLSLSLLSSRLSSAGLNLGLYGHEGGPMQGAHLCILFAWSTPSLGKR